MASSSVNKAEVQFALVKYTLGNTLEIVPISRIVNFNIKKVHQKLFRVKWTDRGTDEDGETAEYRAVVLLTGGKFFH